MPFSLARRMSSMKASTIREILKVTERPEIISFAGGLPAPELFPLEAIEKAHSRVMRDSGRQALQYSTTEGYPPLREWVAKRMNERWGTSLERDNILITHGSQQSLDLAGKVFFDEGDVVICESPTYLAAITAFRAYGASFREVPTDDHGMEIEPLHEILDTTPNVKGIYVIPDFQNPTGKTWSLERRKALVEAAEARNIPILEDNPYGELRFEGEFLPMVMSLSTKGTVLGCGTFSKIFCPGYRIGWLAANKEVIKSFVVAKQGTDLHTSTISQMVLSRFLQDNDIDAHIEIIRKVYKKRRDTLVASMDREFPKSISFVRPNGGLFSWADLPEGLDATKILQRSLEKEVAFVPGETFFPNSGKKNTMRLNYSNMPEVRIEEGITRLGSVLREFI